MNSHIKKALNESAQQLKLSKKLPQDMKWSGKKLESKVHINQQRKMTKMATKKKIEPLVGVALDTNKASSVVETGLVKLGKLQNAVVPITSDAQYGLTGITLREVKSLIERAEEERTAIVKPINDGVKRVNEFFKKLTAPAKEFEQALKQELVAYQDAKRLEAMKAAEKEAKKLEKRSPEAAADLRMAAETREVVPSVAGVELRKTWSFQVEDAMALCKAVAVGTAPPETLLINEQFLRRYASTMKGSAKLEGVRFFEVSGIAASAS